MRAFIISIILCLIVSSQVHAQRYFPGLVGIQAKAGVVDGFHVSKGDKQAYSFGFSMNMYTNKAHQWVFGIEYLEKKNAYKETLIPLQQYTLDVGYYHTLYAFPSRTFYLLAGVSGMGGYEQVNKGKKLLYDGASLENKDRFVGGCALTLEFETFLSDKFIFTLTARERILFGSTTGNFHFQLSAGFRFIINN